MAGVGGRRTALGLLTANWGLVDGGGFGQAIAVSVIGRGEATASEALVWAAMRSRSRHWRRSRSTRARSTGSVRETIDRLADLVEERLAKRREAGEGPLLTPLAAAEIAGVHPETLRRAIRTGGIEVAGYVGARARLRRSAVDAWIAGRGSHPRVLRVALDQGRAAWVSSAANLPTGRSGGASAGATADAAAG